MVEGLSPNDIEYLIQYLKEQWEDHEDYFSNPTAFTKTKLLSENLMFCCPVHQEDKPSCGVKLTEPYGWNCFSCGAGGGIGKLAATIYGGNEAIGEYYIEKLFFYDKGLEPINPVANRVESLLMGGGKETPFLSEEEGLKYKGILHPYMAKRGFTQVAVEKYELGYDNQTGSIVFPIRDLEGRIRFLQRRSVGSKNFLNEKGIEKRDIVYGLCYLFFSERKFNEIYLTESATDTISCYLNRLPSGSLLGRVLHEGQIKALKQAGIETLNLFLDNDKAGIEATKEIKKKAEKEGFRVRCVVYPNSICKDANELHLAGAMKGIRLVSFEDEIKNLLTKGIR